MGPPNDWTFYDFRNERNENEIRRWTNGPGRTAKARLNALVRNLSVVDRPFMREDKVGLLRKDGPGHGENLIELIITIGRVEFRPIGWYGPDIRTVTLLVGATERDGKFDPRKTRASKRSTGSDS